MGTSTSAESLLVHLVVDDQVHSELKYAQRCREARAAFRELFLMKEKRALADAGPIAANDASILVRGTEDIAATESWAKEFKRLIFRVTRVDHVPGPFAEEVKKKEKKSPKSVERPAALTLDDEDDEEPTHLPLLGQTDEDD